MATFFFEMSLKFSYVKILVFVEAKFKVALLFCFVFGKLRTFNKNKIFLTKFLFLLQLKRDF